MLRLLASREALLLGALAVLLALIATRFPGFVTPANLLDVFNDTSPLILLAIGQMIVILTKCIDLSVAANLALTGMVVSMINVAAPGVPVVVILAVAIGLGTLLGMVNGILVWKLDIPPIVVTLGTIRGAKCARWSTVYKGAGGKFGAENFPADEAENFWVYV